jgi:hypothetical protein
LVRSSSQNNNNNNYESEWEKSLESIDNFDKILVDLRKTGFTILTGLTAASTIFQLGLNIQTGIIHATSILVIILFWLDLYYQNVLAGAILRAHFLELFRLKRGISFSITSIYNKAKLHRYTNFAYVGFFIAIVIIGYAITIDVEKEKNSIGQTIKYENVENNSTSNNKLSIEISKISNRNINLNTNSNLVDKIIGDITHNLTKIFQTELSRVSLLFLIGEIGSISYLWIQSLKKRNLIDTILKIYYYFLRVEIQSEYAINDLEKIIMRITSSHIEEETLNEDEYIVSNILPSPYLHRDPIVAKLILIRKNQWQLWGIGRKRTTIFWVFISKIGILIIEPKTSKRFKIISKTNLPIQIGDTVENIFNNLKNNHIFRQINIDDNKILKITTEFHSFLNE